MANQTDSREPNRQDGKIQQLAAGVVEVFRGAMVSFLTTGLLGKSADLAATEFAGVVVKSKNNTVSGERIEIYREGVFEFVYGPGDATVANCGTLVYVVDDQTVSLVGVTTNDVLVGRIVEVVSATTVRVDITNRV